MPDISGVDVMHELRQDESGKSLKIVAYTGYANPEEIENLKNLGFDGVLIKPITSRKLLEILNSD
jgi:CheY-like chemotaxis protein